MENFHDKLVDRSPPTRLWAVLERARPSSWTHAGSTRALTGSCFGTIFPLSVFSRRSFRDVLIPARRQPRGENRTLKKSRPPIPCLDGADGCTTGRRSRAQNWALETAKMVNFRLCFFRRNKKEFKINRHSSVKWNRSEKDQDGVSSLICGIWKGKLSSQAQSTDRWVPGVGVGEMGEVCQKG